MNNNEDILEFTINLALKMGMDEIIALRKEGTNYQIRFSNSAIDISKEWNENLLELFLVKEQKTTQVDVEAPTPKKIEKTLSRTVKYLSKVPRSNLYNGMETQQHSYSSMKDFLDKRIFDFPEKAAEYINSALNASKVSGIKKLAGVFYFGYFSTNLLTSHDVKGTHESSYYQFTIRAFADERSSGQGIACGRNLDNIDKKLSNAANHAKDIARMAEGGTQGKAGIYDLIMSPTVAANVFGQLTNAAQPLLMMIGMSPIKIEDIGKKIAHESLTIWDDALLKEGLHSHPFDVEGTPSGKTTLIENGFLKGILHNTSTAKQFGSKTTGNSTFYSLGIGSKFLAPAPSNIVFKEGDYHFEEMIHESRKPTIYVTSNWYTRFTNMLEGSFSTIPRDGMFLIQRGKILKPVEKLRISDNIHGMLNRIEAIGKKIIQIKWWEVPTPTFLPAIKIKDVNMTAATQ